MNQVTLHELPQVAVDQGAGDKIKQVASGQKLIIYAILINFATLVLEAVVGEIAGIASLVALALALFGMFRLSSGMGMPLVAIILTVALMLVPLVNLLALLIVNSRATAALRSAGYKVGFLGASKQLGARPPVPAQ